jgi:hypothetical protein
MAEAGTARRSCQTGVDLSACECRLPGYPESASGLEVVRRTVVFLGEDERLSESVETGLNCWASPTYLASDLRTEQDYPPVVRRLRDFPEDASG